MEQYSIKIENFEGPLDLLMHLIEKNKMDIMDIKISVITDQYLEYLQQMQLEDHNFFLALQAEKEEMITNIIWDDVK